MEITTHTGTMIEVVQKEIDRNGTKKIFEFARRSPGVRLIVPKGDHILLTKEFRHELKTYDYRLPGGKVFDSLKEYKTALQSGVDIAEAAKNQAVREALEEAGIVVNDLSLVHTSVCGATVVWDLFYFVVQDYTDAEQHLEDGEDVTVEYMTREQARAMCLDGSISEERSALILLRYLEGKLPGTT